MEHPNTRCVLIVFNRRGINEVVRLVKLIPAMNKMRKEMCIRDSSNTVKIDRKKQANFVGKLS